MDGWVLNDELSTVSPQPLIVTEEAADTQRSHSAPSPSYIIRTPSSLPAHTVSTLCTVLRFITVFLNRVSISAVWGSVAGRVTLRFHNEE